MDYQFRITGQHTDRIVVVSDGITTIGRKRQQGLDDTRPGVEADINLDSDRVSWRHAELECRNGNCIVRDTNSANGTFFQGKKMVSGQFQPLRLNDEFILFNLFTIQFIKVIRDGTQNTPSTPATTPQASYAQIETSHATVPGTAPITQPIDAIKQSMPSTPPPLEVVFQPPPPDAPLPPDIQPSNGRPYDGVPPPWLTCYSQKLIHYLPEIYQPASYFEFDKTESERGPSSHDSFLARYLGIFEATLLPIDWSISNFDLFLDIATTPTEFLSWWEIWFPLIMDSRWDALQRRKLLAEAVELFNWRGTKRSLLRIVELYTGRSVEIDDEASDLAISTFRIRIAGTNINEIENLNLLKSALDLFKPAHTSYILQT